MPFWTNRGKYLILADYFRNAAEPTNFYIILIKNTATIDADSNTVGSNEITAGNGYTSGGYQLNRDGVDFDTLVEDDTNNWARILIKDVAWGPAGPGTIPPAGETPFDTAVITTDEVVVANRQIVGYWALGDDYQIAIGETITLQDLDLRITNADTNWTNRGKYLLLDTYFRNAAEPTNLYIALVTADDLPTAATNTMADLTEITAGNGYTSGGYQLSRNSTDFDTLTEDDTDDMGRLFIKDITWTATGGTIPASGDGASYAVLTTDDAAVADRKILQWWTLGSPRTVPSGQDFILQDLEIRLIDTV